MKVLTITGTRPELIRLSLIIKKLDKLVDHILIYTNQNYDKNLSTIFFDELGIRNPDYYFDSGYNSFGEYFGNSIIEFEKILKEEKPDKILILGDTNSGLLSIIAERYKIPIYHMEAGNRCFDERVPEEINRKIIDITSTYNLPYTENSKQNLLSEGFHKNKIYKTGNPIYEVLNHYEEEIDNSNILDDLHLLNGVGNDPVPMIDRILTDYVLVTIHRAENVDDGCSLEEIFKFLNTISKDKKVIFPIHPRTKSKISDIKINSNIILTEPMGFFDFVKLEKHAFCVISDSGTVTEETMIFGVPSLIVRESTERQELIENGSSILTGINYNTMMDSYNNINKVGNKWDKIDDYFCENVSDKVIRILLGKK